MAVFFLDNFVDANGTNLGSHTPDTGTGWTNHPSLNAGAVGAIQTNRHYGSVTNSHWYIDDAAPGSTADYKVSCETFVQPFGGNTLGIYLYGRFDTSANTGYWVRSYDAGSGNGGIQLGKTVAGTNTSLAVLSSTYGSYTHVILELEMVGTTITCYARIVSSGDYILSDGTTTSTRTACHSVTDGSITAAGRGGINASNSLATTRTHIEWFQAETLTNEFTESVTSNMSLSQELNGIDESVTTNMALASNIVFFNVENDREVPQNVLNFTQSVEVEGLIQSRESVISFSQSATNFLLGTQIPSSNLGLSSNATVVFGVPHSAPWGVAGLSQDLELESDITNIADRVVSSTLSFSDEAIASYGFESVMALTSVATGGVGQEIEQDLGVTQIVARGGSEWLRSGTGTLVMTSAANGWNGNDKCFRRYGDTTQLTAPGTLSLFSKDGLYSVVLKNPEIDNTRRTAFDRVLRETRGGELIVYRDENWNVVQTLLFTITALKRTTLDSLQTFFLNTLGEEITLVDWLGEEWSGVVTRPNETVTEDREGYWTMPFEFEGTKQEGSSNTQNLGLSSAASATVESPP